MATVTKYSARKYLLTGKVSGSSAWMKRVLNSFQRDVEAEIVALYGELRLFDATTIQSAARHEGVAQLFAKLLKEEGNKLTVEQRLAVCREISNETDKRDRCLKSLGLDRRDVPVGQLTIDIAPEEPEAASDAEQ